MNRFKRTFKPLELLSEDKIDLMIGKTLQVLQDTGVIFQSKRALKLFKRAGCNVKHDEMRVFLPNDVVKECLNNCPDEFSIQARDSKNSLDFGDDSLYFYNSMGNKTVNLNSWEMERPSLDDQDEAVSVLDSLDNLHIIGCYTPYMDIKGVSPFMTLPVTFASRLRNSSKIVQTGYSNESEIFAIQMA